MLVFKNLPFSSCDDLGPKTAYEPISTLLTGLLYRRAAVCTTTNKACDTVAFVISNQRRAHLEQVGGGNYGRKTNESGERTSSPAPVTRKM